jgi:NAD(P)-dependent dehydrogenase (short-subunit alcohol dehydrogenase family)
LSKTALITGANKGIGYETARRLGELGYRVWIGARDVDRGAAAAQALRDLGQDVRHVTLAVEDDASVQSAIERIQQEDGKLDVLINNAAMPGAFVDPVDQDIEDIRQVYDINVLGPIRMIQAAIPLLKAGSQASIVNVSSELGSLGALSDPGSEFYGVNALGYNSSKTALNAVTVSFAKALAPFGIRVNSADPGFTATDFNGNSGYKTVQQAADIIVDLAHAKDANAPTGGFFNDLKNLPW